VDSLCFVVRGTIQIKFKLGLMGQKALNLAELEQGGVFGEECSVACRKQTR
jgi:hypothetical protein